MPDRDSRWPRKMCAVCHLRLNPREDLRGNLTGYLHAMNADHDPRPVNEVDGEQILVCDICLVPHPTWDIPAGAMQPVAKGDAVVFSVSDWAACTPCKNLLVDGQWDALAERALAGHMKQSPEVYRAIPALIQIVRANMRTQMQDLKKAITGPPIEIQQATWLAHKLRDVLGE